EERVAELRETSRASGGGELLDLGTAWRRPPAPGEEPIRIPLLVAIFVLFLLEALATRTGWRVPRLAKRLPSLARARAQTKAAVAEPPAPSLPESLSSEPPAPLVEDDRKSRFRRAKKGL